MYTLVWTTGFTRTAGKFLKQHPELKGKFAALLGDLERDPFQPHLRYQPLVGKLKGVQLSVRGIYKVNSNNLTNANPVLKQSCFCNNSPPVHLSSTNNSPAICFSSMRVIIVQTIPVIQFRYFDYLFMRVLYPKNRSLSTKKIFESEMFFKAYSNCPNAKAPK